MLSEKGTRRMEPKKDVIRGSSRREKKMTKNHLMYVVLALWGTSLAALIISRSTWLGGTLDCTQEELHDWIRAVRGLLIVLILGQILAFGVAYWTHRPHQKQDITLHVGFECLILIGLGGLCGAVIVQKPFIRLQWATGGCIKTFDDAYGHTEVTSLIATIAYFLAILVPTLGPF